MREASRERFGSIPSAPSTEAVRAANPGPTTRDTPKPTNPPPSVKQPSEQSVSTAEPAVDKATLDYLALVARSPFLTVREPNATLGLSAWRGDRIRNAIVAAGLAEEVAIHPGGRGERFKLLDFTETGRDLLAR